jgi:hypothetical protein
VLSVEVGDRECPKMSVESIYNFFWMVSQVDENYSVFYVLRSIYKFLSIGKVFVVHKGELDGSGRPLLTMDPLSTPVKACSLPENRLAIRRLN